MYNKLFVIALLTFSVSCAPKLHSQAALVRTVSQDYKEKNCEFLGIVEGYGVPLTGGASAAFTGVRNSVAIKGGNAMYIISNTQENIMGVDLKVEPGAQTTTIFAEALKCKLPEKDITN